MEKFRRQLAERSGQEAKHRWLVVGAIVALAGVWFAIHRISKEAPSIGNRDGDFVSPDGALTAFERHVSGKKSFDEEGLVIVYLARTGIQAGGEPVWGGYDWPKSAIRWLGPRALEVAEAGGRDGQVQVDERSIVVDGERVTVVRWVKAGEERNLERIAPLQPVADGKNQ